jgi:outer membrane protein assembly factor BamB
MAGPVLKAGPAEVYGAWVKTALVGGVFCLLICIVLLIQHGRAQADDPLKASELAMLKEKLLSNPRDEKLKKSIREVDLQVRRQYFRQILLNRTGAWLLVGSVGLLILAGRQGYYARQHLPLPNLDGFATSQAHRKGSRWSVVLVGVFTGLAAVCWIGSAHTVLPSKSADLEKLLAARAPEKAVTPDWASPQEMAQNWPRFRGPDGNGVSTETNVPLSWDVKTGAGIIWKAEVPAAGFNSPILWGDRLFMSGGDAAKREVMCFSCRDGALLWRQAVQNVAGSPAQVPEVPEQTGYAAPTMATDGRRVYAMFATGDLAAFTLDGKMFWAKNLGVPKNPHGHATSLVPSQGRLIVQFDQGEAEQNASRLYAFEGATGQIVWQRPRPVPASWATPLVIDLGEQPQIITLGVPWIMAYSAKDGTELWRAEGLANEVTPSAIYAAGLIYAVSPNEKLLALRPDGHGDVTKTHIAWSSEDNIPDISSPTSNGELLFTVTTPGLLTCYDAKDGKKQWEQDLAMECHASPSIANGRLYVTGTKGIVVVLELGRQPKELARSDLGEKVYASPAFAPGRIFFRGVKHLFCIGSAGGNLARSN